MGLNPCPWVCSQISSASSFLRLRALGQAALLVSMICQGAFLAQQDPVAPSAAGQLVSCLVMLNGQPLSPLWFLLDLVTSPLMTLRVNCDICRGPWASCTCGSSRMGAHWSCFGHHNGEPRRCNGANTGSQDKGKGVGFTDKEGILQILHDASPPSILSVLAPAEAIVWIPCVGRCESTWKDNGPLVCNVHC